MDQQTFQLVVIAINALWGIVLLLGGIMLRHLLSTLGRIDNSLQTLNTKVLEHYATKAEIEALRGFVSGRTHDMRDDLQTHEVWIQLIARQAKIELPPRINRGS